MAIQQTATAQKVWIEGTNLKSLRPSPALTERRYGPFEVIEKIGASAYRIRIPDTWTTHDVFNESVLTPYREPWYANQQQPHEPEPVMVERDDGEIAEEHEVEAVVNSKIVGRKPHQYMKYLIKWKGWPESENEWREVEDMQGALEAIDEYHAAHPDRRRII